MSGVAQLTLDMGPQDREFMAVQQRMIAKHGERWTVLQERVLLFGARGKFTADDVMDDVRELYADVPNLIGSVIGCLAGAHRIRSAGRRRSTHKAAKGRGVVVWELAEPPQRYVCGELVPV